MRTALVALGVWLGGPAAAVLGSTGQAGEPPRPANDHGAAFEPVPVPEPTAEALRYYREGWWLWGLSRALTLAVPAAVLASGLSARMGAGAWSLAGRLVPERASGGRVRGGVRRLIAIATYGMIYLGLMAIATLPLAYWAGFLRPHAYGLSNQSFGRWLGHWGIDLAVSLALTIPALWVVYGLIARSPRRWWLAVGLLTVPVAFAMALAKPVLIDPLYNDFGPMPDRVLEARILALAARAGVDGSRVYQVDMSRDTSAVNAYVTGFLGTKRIVLWDTLTAKLDEDQVLVILAHELGHYVRGHVVRGLLVSSALTLIGLYAVHRGASALLRRFGPRWRVERLADIASLPALLVMARLVALVLFPIGYAYSRHIEHEADLFALELTRDNRAAATAFVALQRENLGHPRPDWLSTILRSTHPSLGDRIDFSNTYRPWADGQPLRFGHLFPPDPTPPPPDAR